MADITSGVTGQNLIAAVNDKLDKSSGGSVKNTVDFWSGIETDKITSHNGDTVKLLEYISTTMPSGDFLSYCGGFGIKNLVVGTYVGNDEHSQNIVFKDVYTGNAPNYVHWVKRPETDDGLANWVIVFRLENRVDTYGKSPNDSTQRVNNFGFATRKTPFNMKASTGYSGVGDIDYALISLKYGESYGCDYITVSNYYDSCETKEVNGKTYCACPNLGSKEYGFNEEGITYVYIAGV